LTTPSAIVVRNSALISGMKRFTLGVSVFSVSPIVVGSRGFSGAGLILQNVSPAGQFPNYIEEVHS
jgi:hypothetical protein